MIRKELYAQKKEKEGQSRGGQKCVQAAAWEEVNEMANSKVS